MICPECKKNLPPTDYVRDQDICYRCSYALKNKITKEVLRKEPSVCKTCGKQIKFLENVKKRQRNVYCSSECASVGHKNINNNYWTRKLRQELKLSPRNYA